ncbi:periplasmic thioredoxin of cytochrome c-type biogenesis [Psychromonas sp. MME2]|uniref:periplasmic thioredoxin of cytochrome c-type biogenesis n=1 Tax=unclassified Psychromonas TaxID=2614957 RepID=UPI00339C7AB5
MLKNITAQQATALLDSKDTFIINIVASWCSDCVDQSKNIADFAAYCCENKIPVYQLNVQDIKNEYLSATHEAVTMCLGGRGYPRTALIKAGIIVDADNVEVISSDALAQLAEKFIKSLK